MSVQPTVLLIAGSPSDPSRSAALLDAVNLRLALRDELKVVRLNIRKLPAEALLLAQWGHPAITGALAQVERADAIVIATPVYKAAYSGVLKVFLDLLPQTALKNKTVLPLATGGSPHHMLALDYALRPVLQALSARHILPGVYATDAQIPRSEEGIYAPAAEISIRLDEAVATLLAESFRMPPPRFEPVLFSQVRCSV
ncbi:MAG: NADPH-dependent reductase [Polaromonas sp.]|nr:NADPH-dependent reductase [Polaromonas sp.]